MFFQRFSIVFSTVLSKVFHIIHVVPRLKHSFPAFCQRFFHIIHVVPRLKHSFSNILSKVFPYYSCCSTVKTQFFHRFSKGFPYYSCCSTVKTQFFHIFFTGVPCFPYFFHRCSSFSTAMSSQDGQGGPPRRHRGDREELGHRALGSNKISGEEIGIEYNCGKYHKCGAIHIYIYMLGNPIYAIYLPFGNGKNSTHKK